MANTKNDETMVDVTDVVTEAPKAKATPAKKVAKKYAADDRIECRSVTTGELILVGPKSKLQYIWSDYGDVTSVEYQDLLALHSLRSPFLVKPRFIIEDEDLVEQWSSLLQKLYDTMKNQDLDKLFQMTPAKFKTALAKLPAGMKESVKTRAVNMIRTEELYDIRIVRAIDEILGTELADMFLG